MMEAKLGAANILDVACLFGWCQKEMLAERNKRRKLLLLLRTLKKIIFLFSFVAFF